MSAKTYKLLGAHTAGQIKYERGAEIILTDEQAASPLFVNKLVPVGIPAQSTLEAEEAGKVIVARAEETAKAIIEEALKKAAELAPKEAKAPKGKPSVVKAEEPTDGKQGN